MTWDKNSYSNADILFLHFESVQTTSENGCDSVRHCCSMAEPAAPLEDFYSALIFLADEAFNRNNESSLGMVAM